MANIEARVMQTMTADGNSDQADCVGAVLFAASGAFGGGTFTPYLLDGNNNEIPLTDGALTATGTYRINLPLYSRNKVFGKLVGSAGASLNVWINGA